MSIGSDQSHAPDLLDPEIRLFQRRISAGFAAHPDLAGLSRDEARRVAEEVRRPWRTGGPVMHTTTEHTLDIAGRDVRVRIHKPGGAAPLPGLVYVHGGGWVMFSLDTHDRLMREYARRAQVCVIGVDYALSPEARFPVALNEIVGVVSWLRDHGAALGVDPERLSVGGDSAGANLSVGAALSLRDRGCGHLLKAMVLNYGVYECGSDNPSHAQFGGEGFMLTPDEMAAFVESYLGSGHDLRDPLASPLFADLAGLPPAFMTVADCDVLHDENIAMARRLAAAGVEVRLKVYPGTTHSFLEAVSIARISRTALQDASIWLSETLRKS